MKMDFVVSNILYAICKLMSDFNDCIDAGVAHDALINAIAMLLLN